MSISEAQRKKDPHAGPGESFPEDPEHIRAAWDLAGHAADPEAVRRKVLAYARAHGLMDRLPETARQHDDDRLVRKATGDQVSQLLDHSYAKCGDMGDGYSERMEKRNLIEWAQRNGIAKHLPDEAHGFMHEQNMPHTHDGEDQPYHTHPVVKAFNPVGVSFTIKKSWGGEAEGDPVHFEGWVSKSTGKKDLAKEIVEPEAFLGAADSYFERRAPISYEHGTSGKLPAGHLQAAVILRDGLVLKAVKHPSDPAEFEQLPTKGTGVYVRGVLTDATVAKSVKQGDTGGMSYIANLTKYEPLPGGGRRHLEYSTWIESCVAPYPVNPEAVITVAKAFGLTEEPMNTKQTELPASLEEILAEAGVLPTAETVTKADLKGLVEAFQAGQKELVETIQKALIPTRGEGVGRVGEHAPAADARETDPVGYIVKKAIETEDAGKELSVSDKDLAYRLFSASMFKPVARVGSADDDEE
jgi:hypothetical protein